MARIAGGFQEPSRMLSAPVGAHVEGEGLSGAGSHFVSSRAWGFAPTYSVNDRRRPGSRFWFFVPSE